MVLSRGARCSRTAEEPASWGGAASPAASISDPDSDVRMRPAIHPIWVGETLDRSYGRGVSMVLWRRWEELPSRCSPAGDSSTEFT